ncbi:MAG TPA: hypothetical protein VL754_02385 [Verrucomicrobiae bacterium]|jgi:hypothetical protein|nr:hypothetical protein [Verrucomicrobiae bacterium]
MRAEALGPTVVRIELVHVALIVALWLALAPTKAVDPVSLLAGGLFMGVNFLLLSSGIRWVLTPFAGKGRVRSGVILLVLKLALFLGAILLLLTRVRLDALSFTLGFSSLLAAIFFERMWALTR